jgi:Ras-related protein Rab-18
LYNLIQLSVIQPQQTFLKLLQVRTHASHEGAVKMLVANKVDLPKMEVSPKEGLEFAEQHGMLFIETSAKTRKGVKQAFEEVS